MESKSKIKSLIIILGILVELFTLRVWFVCTNFTNIFHKSFINIPLQIVGYTHAERGTPLLLTRLFSNKLTDSFIDFLQLYLQFWDIRFGENWFSVIGYFGIFSGFYYILSNKKKRLFHWIFLFIILLLPWIEILFEPHSSLLVKSVYLWAPFILFSLYGNYQFLSHGKLKNRLIVLTILLVLSIWWLVFVPYAFPRYCSK